MSLVNGLDKLRNKFSCLFIRDISVHLTGIIKIQETKRKWWHKVAIVRRVDSCDFTDKGNYIHLK